ncbi:restriction endonuclease subunit S [Actinosynnema sp. NPDC023794]
MSRIDDLIKEFTPEGVPFKALGDIAVLVRGNGMPKADLTTEGIGAIHYGQIYTRYGVWTEDTLSFVTPETASKLASADPGDIIITNTSENLKDVGKAVAWLGTEPIVTGGHATIIKHSEDPKFLSYWFQSTSFSVQKKALATGTKVIDVSAKQLAKVRVPVPPVEVQNEVVRILDRFSDLATGLQANLDEELRLRRRQYEHYRNQLFTDTTGDVRWSTLGEISTKVSSGGTPSSGRDAYYGGDIPWLRTQEVDYNGITSTGVTITEEGLRNSSAKWIPKHCVIVAMYGATAAKVAINEIPLTTNQACCNLQIDPEQADYRYVFHWVANEYERLKALGEGSQSNLNAKKVKNYPIPVPSLERQRQVVETLNGLDAVVSELSVIVSAERDARRRQYEYYRDRLFAFEELSA